MAESGLPWTGAPVLSATVIAGTPKSTGEPGRTIWASAAAIRASAVTIAMVPVLLAGVLAPAMQKGEHITAWLAAA